MFNNKFMNKGYIDKKLERMNLLLENIFSGLYKEYKRLWYPMSFAVDIPASTTTFTQVAGAKDFPFSYLFTQIGYWSEASANVKLAWVINGRRYPPESYLVDVSNDFTPNEPLAIYSNNGFMTIVPCRLYVDKPFKLQVLGYNSTGTPETCYSMFFGYKITENEVRKVLEKKDYEIK